MTTPLPIACSLEGDEFAKRGEWVRELGQALLAIEADRTSARLRFDARRREELEEFVRAESACCAFFDFGLTTDEEAVELSIGAPEDAGWAVRGLVAAFAAGWEGP